MTAPSPGDFADRLRQIDMTAVLRAAVETQAAGMADAVRAALSSQPGSAPHDFPWLRTGELRDSIGHDADETGAVVGSRSDVALYQEHGTARIPPRPFLAPVAAAHAKTAAAEIGAAVLAALGSV